MLCVLGNDRNYSTDFSTFASLKSSRRETRLTLDTRNRSDTCAESSSVSLDHAQCVINYVKHVHLIRVPKAGLILVFRGESQSITAFRHGNRSHVFAAA